MALSIIVTLLFTALTCCYSGYAADDIPGQMLGKALICFNNKNIYNGCAEPFRLNPSGILNIPQEATQLFCNGPCIGETQLVLNCIDNMFGNFVFYNKATSENVREAIRAGCSYTSQRGVFNPEWFMQGETSNSRSLMEHSIVFYVLLFLFCCFYIM